MKVMVVGAGRVGVQISNFLSAEDNDVIVLEKDPAQVKKVAEMVDALVLQGDGASPADLDKAGIRSCDLLIAVTSIDEVNIIACLTAQKAGVKLKIARLRRYEFSNPDSLLQREDLGIDLIIHPELETARELVWLIKRSAATDVIEFENGRVQLVGVRLDSNSPIINKTLQQVDEENADILFRVVAIYRGNRTIVPTGKSVINRGDQLFFITQTELVPRLLEIVGKSEEKLEHIMILGGGKVGRLVAAELERDKDVHIKIIESSREKSGKIAETLQRTLLIIGDGTDLDLLASEGIMDMDGYIAVTDDEETNIISCLVAKHLGVRRSLALVNRSDYLPIMNSIGVDAAVDKQMITANAIMRFIRRGNIVSLATLRGIDAEVLRIEISQESRVAGKPVRALNLSKDATIGIISRNGDVIVPVGDTILMPRDALIVFTLPSAVARVEKVFSDR
ncbi:MAG TPA: Trk system potassium transporter TrkA [bacterium]|nr:Trk system potassium transporter TrkA [bacterium]HOX84401.1 Trk system potassium transporter TrkA [bacterium]HPG46002.1 Trk system potassium transporter TrkA [bacterium]HPM97824.1 Trk system potassium transporter TrkA [bacterium]